MKHAFESAQNKRQCKNQAGYPDRDIKVLCNTAGHTTKNLLVCITVQFSGNGSMVHVPFRKNRPQYNIKYQAKSERAYGQHGKQNAYNGRINPEVSTQSAAYATQDFFVAVPVEGAAGLRGRVEPACRRVGG